MTDALPSMRRMVWLLTCAGGLLWLLALAGFVWLQGLTAEMVFAALGLAALAVLVVAAGGWITLERQRRLQDGEVDLYLQCNAARSESAVATRRVPDWSSFRRWLAARVFGHRHLVGDPVRIKSLQAIRATLDADGCLDGLPFMDEMASYCGQQMRVYRVVDKIYDYGRSRAMRRLDDTVLLLGLRCDGAAHGGCQAACYLIWKSAWLEPLPAGEPEPRALGGAVAAPEPWVERERYRCQYTELTTASQPMVAGHWRAVFGPWIVGNVATAAFCVALLTRAFNALQSSRGGLCYPWQPEAGNDKSLLGSPLRAGDWVRVRTPAEISRSLDKNSKHKGLWFDRDMLKHCGSTYQVRGRVEKIIDIGTGAMIPMKTPCIVLEGVHYSGEFQNFGEQHDFLYWREAWLEPKPSRDKA